MITAQPLLSSRGRERRMMAHGRVTTRPNTRRWQVPSPLLFRQRTLSPANSAGDARWRRRICLPGLARPPRISMRCVIAWRSSPARVARSEPLLFRRSRLRAPRSLASHGLQPPQPGSGAPVTYEVADVGNEGSVETLIAKVMRDHGALDVVVNTVGGFAAGQPVTDLPLDTWERMLSLNSRTAFLVSKHAGRMMAQQRRGRIINVASRSAYSGRKNAAAYAVSKRAVITLTEAQAEEMRGLGVTVNAIVPSIIDTPANRTGMPSADASRWPTPDQIARVTLFLASDDAALISGAAIPVYGDA